MSERKSARDRRYRYRILDTHGSGTKAVGDGKHLLERRHMGQDYTWTIFDTKTMEETGWIRGVFEDKGWVVDGKYVTEAELSEVPA